MWLEGPKFICMESARKANSLSQVANVAWIYFSKRRICNWIHFFFIKENLVVHTFFSIIKPQLKIRSIRMLVLLLEVYTIPS